MTYRQQKTVFFAAISALAVAGVILDLFTPLGVADWVWYFIPLLLSAYVGGRFFPYVLAAVFSTLTLGGFFLSSPGIDLHLAFMSRFMGVCVQWLMAFLISQRKGVEGELFKSRQMLRLILDNIPQRVFWKDRNLKYLGCNRHFALDGGYSDPNELVGKSDFEVSWKAIADRYRADDQQVLDTGKPKLNYDEPQVRSDGAKLWLTTSKAPLLDQAGRVIGVLGTYEDITERKRTEKELKESKIRFESLFEDAPVGYHELNEEGRVTRVNRTELVMLGYAAEEIVGHFVWDFVAEREIAREATMARLSGNALVTQVVERNYRRKDGTFLPVLIENRILCDDTGRVTGIRSTLQDITERKRAEEALRKSEQKYRELVEYANSIIVRWKHDGQITFLNEFGQRFFGYSAEEIFGRHVVGTIVPETESTGQDLRPLMDRIRADPKAFEQNVNENMRRNGERVWIAWTNKAVLDEQGRVSEILSIGTDITMRKRTEEALAKERNLFRALMDNIPDVIYFKDRESHFAQINPALARHFGLSDPAEATGKTDFDFFSKEHARQAYEDEQAIIRSGEPLVGKEEKETWSDGRVGWVSTTKMPLRNQEGQIVGTFGISRDITERKRAEEEREQSVSLLRATLESTADGILVVDSQGKIVGFNDRFIQLWHIPQTIISSRSDQQVLAFVLDQLKDPEGFRTKVHQLYAQPEAESFEVLEFKDGRVFERYSLPQRVAGRPVGRVWSFRDATERKRAEVQVREQARLLDLANDAIIVRDMEDRILYWNRGAEQLFGWTTQEATGRKINDLLKKDAPNALKYEKAKKTVLEKGDWKGEFATHTKNGQEALVEVRWTLVRDHGSNPQSIMGINTDISEKKKLEAQFLRSQRMESIGTLAGGIAHDLNNVLTPLLFSVEVLKEKITDADGQRLLEALETNVQRGASLVKQVLAFGRGVTGERITVQPRHIAREIKQIIHETFPKSVEFEFHSTENLWTTIGDPTQLHQVLLNLCVNARDAMPNGGKLSIHMENVTFDEVYTGMNPEAKAGPYVCIEVTDTGTGIPKEIQDKIFDPFFTTKEPGKGTGLGLSTTLTIVKSHGGFIHCHSAPGKGATFKVYLPADNAVVSTENVVAGQPKLPRGDNELVLVVDDEEPIRNLAQRALERFGYRVLLAADGSEAVSLYAPRRNEIDVVITDMVMPVMDGPATIAALKIINPEVKIVGSSGLASDGGMARARDAGVRHFIPKPYTTEAMLNTLHEALNGKR
ncbi:MAG: PAS domain S-box protein [Verrucomicrobiota bacterium]